MAGMECSLRAGDAQGHRAGNRSQAQAVQAVYLPHAHPEGSVVAAEGTSVLPLSHPTAAEPMILLLPIPQRWLSMAQQEIIATKYFTIPNYINFSVISCIFSLRQKRNFKPRET